MRDFLRALRTRWLTVVICTVLGGLLAFGWTLLQTKLYVADATGMVTTGSSENIGLALSADNLAKSRAKQYEVLASDRSVASRALEIAELEGDPNAVSAAVAVSVPIDTAQMKVSVTRPDPKEAALLANAWVNALGESISKLQGQSDEDSGGTTPAIGGGTSVIKLTLVSEAQVPGSPASPNRQLALAIGILAGLVGGLAYVAIRGFFDRRIRSIKTIEEDFGLSVVGTIPITDAIGDERILKTGGTRRSTQENFRITEAFKELRTNLQFMSPDNPPRIIAVTSSLPGDGKSTVAANIAKALSETGVPVVLVDGDLRRPTVAKTFGLVDGVGLTDVVVDRARIEDVLQPADGHDSLMVMGSGPTPPNPSEILSSTKLGTVLEELSRDYMVIVDAPPLLAVTDAAILAARFDGALLVVQANKTTKDELKKAVSSLEKVNGHILGTVLNRVPTNKGESGYYQYYGSNYYYSNDNVGAKGSAASGKKRKKRSGTGARQAQANT